MVLGGDLGQLTVSGAERTADTPEITVVTQGDISLSGGVFARDGIRLEAVNVNLLQGSLVEATGEASRITLRGGEGLYLAAASGDAGAATVRGPGLLHLLGDQVQLDGRVLGTSSEGRVVVNAVGSVAITGEVVGDADVALRAGVVMLAGEAALLGDLTLEDLNAGDIVIQGEGHVAAAGKGVLLAGGDVTVSALPAMQDGVLARPRPVVSMAPVSVEVVTGYQQVADGYIQVPEVHWVTTEETAVVPHHGCHPDPGWLLQPLRPARGGVPASRGRTTATTGRGCGTTSKTTA